MDNRSMAWPAALCYEGTGLAVQAWRGK